MPKFKVVDVIVQDGINYTVIDIQEFDNRLFYVCDYTTDSKLWLQVARIDLENA